MNYLISWWYSRKNSPSHFTIFQFNIQQKINFLLNGQAKRADVCIFEIC